MTTLDLRKERCPLAIVAKRNVVKHCGERLDILVTDSSSMNDIMLSEKQSYIMKLDNLENGYCITVTMEK